jgi:hypothetical protein
MIEHTPGPWVLDETAEVTGTQPSPMAAESGNE